MHMSTASHRQKSLMKVLAQCAVADTFLRLKEVWYFLLVVLGHIGHAASLLSFFHNRYGTPDVTRTSAVLASGNDSNRMQSEVAR